MKVPRSKSSIELSFPGVKRPGSERAWERKFQGTNWPRNKKARERIGQGIGRFAPGSEKARYRTRRIIIIILVWLITASDHIWPNLTKWETLAPYTGSRKCPTYMMLEKDPKLFHVAAVQGAERLPGVLQSPAYWKLYTVIVTVGDMYATVVLILLLWQPNL